MMNSVKSIILLTVLLLVQVTLIAQEEVAPLQQQMSDIMQESRTYTQYKVVPISKLESLFEQVNDSLESQREAMTIARVEAMRAAQEAERSMQSAKQVQESLAASEALNETIQFLGVDFQKTVYNVLVWGLIILALTGVVLMYVMFKRSHKVTKAVQKDLESIRGEFEQYKTQSHQKQVKLKRELQTALNTLNEKGIKS